jgi:hypothetical protein
MKLTARERWKRGYRAYRIERRECAKAQRDMLLFGAGYVILNDGTPERVHPEDVVLLGNTK